MNRKTRIHSLEIFAFLALSLPVCAQQELKQTTIDTLSKRIERARLAEKNPSAQASPEKPLRDTINVAAKARVIVKNWNSDATPAKVKEAFPDSIFREMIARDSTTSVARAIAILRLTQKERLKQYSLYIPLDTAAFQLLTELGAVKLDSGFLSVPQLQKIQSYGVLQELYLELERYILYKEGQQRFNRGIEDNLDKIAAQSEYISHKEFSEYRFTETSKQILKGINIYHDNDFFSPGTNRDMNYTGGLRIELTTDLLKMRLLANTFFNAKAFRVISKIPVLNFFSQEIRRLKKDNISYQGLFYGIEAYTPYLRFDSTGNALQMSGALFPAGQKLNRQESYRNDRPFASIAYLGRAKYRMNEMGTVRTKGEFSLGILGGNIGKSFQSALHRDLTIDSPQPIGWENQIANGGRLTINMAQSMEFMLFSKKNDVFKNIEKNKNHKGRAAARDWTNFYGSLEGRLGQQTTSFGAGLGFSNLNFRDRSGTQMIKTRPAKNYNVVVSVDVRYRRIVHNSMLEGFGWFNTRESDGDGNSDESLSKWKLDKNTVNRNLIVGNVFLGFRTIKTMIFYNWNVNNREFFAEKINNTPQSQQNKLFNLQKWYAVGRVGFNFLM